ncbi:hypothetical protein [Microcoleus vaginatus]|uniref:hypothetical protein n=1 Tax=Microcoleus vaginatus TaxID=119532 RepID=UPI001F611CB0|nr:hypothetical protein D0A37_18345 [Microcoleus vaginatus HSN003]
MKRKLKLLCYSFGPEAPTGWQNHPECKPGPTQQDAQPLALLVRRVADAAFTYAYLTSGPNL